MEMPGETKLRVSYFVQQLRRTRKNSAVDSIMMWQSLKGDNERVRCCRTSKTEIVWPCHCLGPMSMDKMQFGGPVQSEGRHEEGRRCAAAAEFETHLATLLHLICQWRD
jgi:hypothetical protein